MSLLRPQPDHRNVWTIHRQLCWVRDQRGTDKRGPPSLETTDLTSSLARGFPHPHLGSCPLTTTSPPCYQAGSTALSQWGDSLQRYRQGQGGEIGCSSPHPSPQLSPTLRMPYSESQGKLPAGLDGTSPLSASHPGDPRCRESRNTPPPPSPASGYPFGSDPRPGLSQTVPCPIPPLRPIDPPTKQLPTPHPPTQLGLELGGISSPHHPQLNREAHRWIGIIGHRSPWPSP